MRRLAPLPVLAIELRRSRFIEQPVIAAGPHALRNRRPAAARTAGPLGDKLARLGVEFDSLGKICFVEQRLRDQDPREFPIFTMRLFVAM